MKIHVHDDRPPSGRIGGKLAQVDGLGARYRELRQYRDRPGTPRGHAEAGWRACRSAVARGGASPFEPYAAGAPIPQPRAPAVRGVIGRGDDAPSGEGQLDGAVSKLARHAIGQRHLVVGRPTFLEHQDVSADTPARVHDVIGAAPPVYAAVHVEAGDDHARHCTSRLPIHLCPMGDPAAPAWGRRARIGEPPGRRDAVDVERSLRSLHDPRARRIRSPGTLSELTQPLPGGADSN